MPIVTLPDGKNIEFPKEVTGLDIAEKISKSLLKQALIMSVDGELKDLYFLIKKDCLVRLVLKNALSVISNLLIMVC